MQEARERQQRDGETLLCVERLKRELNVLLDLIAERKEEERGGSLNGDDYDSAYAA